MSKAKLAPEPPEPQAPETPQPPPSEAAEPAERQTSDRKIEANRANAQHSTGPKTPQGKARSALNATKHAFFSKNLYVTEDTREDFDLCLRGLYGESMPVGANEDSLFQLAVRARWNLHRLDREETRVYQSGDPLTSPSLQLTLNWIDRRRREQKRDFIEAMRLFSKQQANRINQLRWGYIHQFDDYIPVTVDLTELVKADTLVQKLVPGAKPETRDPVGPSPCDQYMDLQNQLRAEIFAGQTDLHDARQHQQEFAQTVQAERARRKTGPPAGEESPPPKETRAERIRRKKAATEEAARLQAELKAEQEARARAEAEAGRTEAAAAEAAAPARPKQAEAAQAEAAASRAEGRRRQAAGPAEAPSRQARAA
jgi:hypothetical protein